MSGEGYKQDEGKTYSNNSLELSGRAYGFSHEVGNALDSLRSYLAHLELNQYDRPNLGKRIEGAKRVEQEIREKLEELKRIVGTH